MVQLSLFNNTYIALPISGSYVGAIESTNNLVSISVNVLADVPVRVIIRQYRTHDETSLVQANFTDVAASTRQVVQEPIKGQFFAVEILNQSGSTAATITEMTSYLQSTHYVNLDIRKLSAAINGDSVVCYGVDISTGLKHPLNVNADGSIILGS